MPNEVPAFLNHLMVEGVEGVGDKPRRRDAGREEEKADSCN